ncbi:hypothetical protein HDU83_002462 [Entophlyctis luteolus]|nr:hypothetical protein HDU83_002462 [Entophlyctis luteolus]
MRFLGNKYVRDEWARHRPLLTASAAELESDVEKKTVRERFLREWAAYSETIGAQIQSAERWEHSVETPMYGRNLKRQYLDVMSDQQIGQLHSLKEEVFETTKKQ